MKFNPKIQPPHAPMISAYGLPDEEREAADSLSTNLHALESYARELLSALALADFCDGQPKTNLLPNEDVLFGWGFLAARGGAMALYNYAKAMAAVRSLLGLCPTWHPRVDGKALRVVEKDFETRFPFYRELRHAIAHEAELWENPKKAQANRPEKGPMFTNCLMGRAFTTTYEGQTIQYDLTQETVLALNDLTRRFFEPFLALDPHAEVLRDTRQAE